MRKNEPEADDIFAARVGVALRELDGGEQAPDVRAAVVERLARPGRAPGAGRTRWLAAAAALLAVAVTAAVLVEQRSRVADQTSASAAQDPVGPWRLVYELPEADLRAWHGGDAGGGLDAALDRARALLQERVGARAEVARAGGTKLVVRFADARPGDVDAVRARIEADGSLEMRLVADPDYRVDGVGFDLPEERRRALAWLDDGGRARLRRDPAAVAELRADSPHLRWFVHRVTPRGGAEGAWTARFVDVPALAPATVPAHTDAEWNGGAVPEAVLARPAADRFLLELVLVNMHEQHFDEADLAPDGVVVQDGVAGGAAVDYRLRPERAGDYADFSGRNTGRCCAILWNGEVLQAPMFRGRIPGRGRLEGFPAEAAAAVAAALESPLPFRRQLLRSERR